MVEGHVSLRSCYNQGYIGDLFGLRAKNLKSHSGPLMTPPANSILGSYWPHTKRDKDITHLKEVLPLNPLESLGRVLPPQKT